MVWPTIFPLPSYKGKTVSKIEGNREKENVFTMSTSEPEGPSQRLGHNQDRREQDSYPMTTPN